MIHEIFYNWFDITLAKYTTVRCIGAAGTAMLLSLMIGPWLIRRLYMLKIGQPIRKDECPPLHILHRNKQGTPTIGGILIILTVLISTLLWANLVNPYIWISIGVFLSLGLLGFVDDYLKVKRKQSLGLRAKQKFAVQIIIAVIFAVIMKYIEPNGLPLYIPFIKNAVIMDMGWFFILWSILVLVGASNAINLTDGLDGLATGTTAISILAYGALAYVASRVDTSNYLFIFHSPNASELTILSAALVGACLGFLWFNAHPAMVFMGDTGSLALGGVIGVIALLIRKECLLLIIGGVFVAEALSVILQIASFKLRNGKKIFKMAPLHHHFEMLGWPETHVTIRFLIIAIICALAGLATLKTQ